MTYESTWVPSLASTGMIRACVTTLGKDIRNVAVGGDDLLDELGKAGINKIGNDANTLGLSSVKSLLDVTGHVLLQHSLDITASLLVGLEDGLRSKKTTLLSAVPVEFDSVLLLALDDVLVKKQNTQCLENSDGTAAIVVGSRSAIGNIISMFLE